MIRDFVFYRAPPATFPRPDGKLKAISLPEDVYIKKFFQKYPLSKGHDAIKYNIPPFTMFLLFSFVCNMVLRAIDLDMHS